jgi:ParB family chromosome partitioning protein
MAKNPLGRGLDALLPQSSAGMALNLPSGVEQREDGTLYAEIDALQANPFQPRSEFDQTALEELAASIRENGVIQPVVIEVGAGGVLYIIAGERRTRAARLAGLQKVPVTVKRYGENKKLEIALIENIQRENLNPLEEASAYARLMESGGMSQDEVAKKVGKNRSTVANALRLLKLPQDMQNALASGAITPGHGRALLSIEDQGGRQFFFARLMGGGMSVREAEQYAADVNKPRPPGGTPTPDGTGSRGGKSDTTPPSVRDPNLARLEQDLLEALGTRVAIRGTFARGTITIDYYSADDLDRLIHLVRP